MPVFVAKKLCPHLIVLNHHGDLYRDNSRVFINVLKDYDPNLESMGLDEASLDLTEYAKNHVDFNVFEECSKIR